MIADVTVVIPCFNSSNTLSRALQSVVEQTVGVKEVIIVDDGDSNFHEIEKIVSLFSNVLNIRLHRLITNCGAPVARNAGIEIATTTFIALLDADDFWSRNKIEIQIKIMTETNADLSCHFYLPNTNPVSLEGHSMSISTKLLFLLDFTWCNPVVTPTVMFRKRSAPVFDSRLRRCDDYKAWIEALQLGSRFILIKAYLAGGGKPPIGYSGLTGSVYRMHRAMILCLYMLYVEHTVSLKFAFLTGVIEMMKLPVRLLKVLLTFVNKLKFVS